MGAVILYGSLDPFSAVAALDPFGFRKADVFFQMADNVLAIAKPEQLLVSFFFSV